MSQANWTKAGASLSHKSACKEFGLEEQDVIGAIRQGKLQYRENYAHGNPYFRLLRDEVENLAKEVHGEEVMELKKIEHEVKKAKAEINSYRRKIVVLEQTIQNLAQRKNAVSE